MKTLKLRTIKNVNIRSGSAERNDENLKGIIYKGREFEIEVEEVEGKEGEDGNPNKIWYKDANGDFFWSGGVELDEKKIKVVSDEEAAINYNFQFKQIPLELRRTQGKNVKVAILDSGINLNHIALNGVVKYHDNSSNSENGIEDVKGHGTHCAGIIGARSNTFVGIAPESELYIAKIISDKNNFLETNLIKGLRWAIHSKNVDVINISVGFENPENPEITNLIKEAYQKNIVVVASAGENSILTNSFSEFWYPAMYDQCIAVGTVSDIFLANNPLPLLLDKLDYIMPYNKIYSCSNNNSEYVKKRGSSMASAFISGVVSLIKSNASNPQNIGLDEIKEVINGFAYEFKENIDLINNLQIFKK